MHDLLDDKDIYIYTIYLFIKEDYVLTKLQGKKNMFVLFPFYFKCQCGGGRRNQITKLNSQTRNNNAFGELLRNFPL